jgi:hypothetical protein
MRVIKRGKYFARSGRNLQRYAVSARAKIFAALDKTKISNRFTKKI